MKYIFIPVLFFFVAFSSNAQLSAESYYLSDETPSFVSYDYSTDHISIDGFEGNDVNKKRRRKKKKGKGGSNLGYGLIAGATMFSVGGEDVKTIEDLMGEKFKSVIGIQAGVVGIYKLTDLFGVKTGLILTQKGSQFKSSTSNDDGGFLVETSMESKDVYNYLVIPLLGYAQFGDDIKIFGNAGPAIGLFTSGKTKSESVTKITGFEDQVESADGKITEGFESIEVALYVGGGVIMPIIERRRKPTISLIVDIGYSMGLTSIATDGEITNSGISFGVGALMGL